MSTGPVPSFDEEAEKIKDLWIDYVKIISEKSDCVLFTILGEMQDIKDE
jgi:hypothetical protein